MRCPLRVTALVPRTLARGIRPGYWLLVAADGRTVLTYAINAEDSARIANLLLPRAGLIDGRLVRSEVGTPMF